ncbi:bacitracin ABC transporter, ATP-binding protein BcrA family protein [Eubacterium brachy ATCC 33089]|nr:bacitracin ABC transporter, ATP-binding protein BcrA family protein [Eubacterium brachy ATCC 33089]
MKRIQIKNLSKEIKGKYILDNINLTFEQGKIYGLYGRNGSGKTMLLRALAGLLIPTEGEIDMDGKVLHKDMDFPENVGIIIENTSLLPQFDGFTNLKQLGKIRNVATNEDIDKALDTVGLKGETKKVKAYSLGMRQRLSIAQAIFEKPELLLLDEPTNALDENYIDKVREILLREKDRGAIVIIASHNKDDLGILADEIISMSDGKAKVMGKRA